MYSKNVIWKPQSCYFSLHRGVDNAGNIIIPGAAAGRVGSRFAAQYTATHSPASGLWQSMMATTGAYAIVWAARFVVFSFGANTSFVVIQNAAAQTMVNIFFRSASSHDVTFTWFNGTSTWESRLGYVPRLGQITNYVFAKIGSLAHHFVNGVYLGSQSVSLTPKVSGSPGNVVFCANPGNVFVESLAFWALAEAPVLNELLDISRDVSVLFKNQMPKKSALYIPTATYPTLSDLKAVNITGSSVQATVDYAF